MYRSLLTTPMYADCFLVHDSIFQHDNVKPHAAELYISGEKKTSKILLYFTGPQIQWI